MIADLALQLFRAAEDDGQHVVEVVRDAACKPPDRFHPQRMAPLFRGVVGRPGRLVRTVRKRQQGCGIDGFVMRGHGRSRKFSVESECFPHEADLAVCQKITDARAAVRQRISQDTEPPQSHIDSTEKGVESASY